MTETAFQADAFQNDAFQIVGGGGSSGGSDNYTWAPSPEVVDRVWRILYHRPKTKRKRKAERLERAALEIMREFEPGPDLPRIDIKSLERAIALLDEPVANKQEAVEALLNKAMELMRLELDDDDAVIIAMYLH
jgi:hypothetical protein